MFQYIFACIFVPNFKNQNGMNVLSRLRFYDNHHNSSDKGSVFFSVNDNDNFNWKISNGIERNLIKSISTAGHFMSKSFCFQFVQRIFERNVFEFDFEIDLTLISIVYFKADRSHFWHTFQMWQTMYMLTFDNDTVVD